MSQGLQDLLTQVSGEIGLLRCCYHTLATVAVPGSSNIEPAVNMYRMTEAKLAACLERLEDIQAAADADNVSEVQRLLALPVEIVYT